MTGHYDGSVNIWILKLKTLCENLTTKSKNFYNFHYSGKVNLSMNLMTIFTPYSVEKIHTILDSDNNVNNENSKNKRRSIIKIFISNDQKKIYLANKEGKISYL